MPKDMKGVMDEWKSGALHSGSKNGPVVKSQKQAVAIGLSQQRQQGKAVPPKPKKKASAGKSKPPAGLSDSHPPGSVGRAPRPIKAPKTLAGRRDASHAKAYPDQEDDY
jgi:hypothetical protein